MGREHQPVLITNAAYSQDRQRHSREVRYMAMMGIRLASLIAAVFLAVDRVPLPWVWGPLCAAGMLIVPWIAVVLANDRPPKDRHRLARNRTGAGSASPDSGMPRRALDPAPEHTVIDADSLIDVER